MRSAPNLKEASKHLTYEWLMFYQTYIALVPATSESRKPNPGVTYLYRHEPETDEPPIAITPENALYNAKLESFIIHARNLIFFFNVDRTGKRAKEDDILAVDFFPNPTDWITRKTLNKEHNKMHKYLAHLTEERKIPYAWDFGYIYEELDKQMIEFVEKVDLAYVRPELRKCLYGEEE
jgi:hypothetical protein